MTIAAGERTSSFRTIWGVLGFVAAVLVAGLSISTRAQIGAGRQSTTASVSGANWPLHNFGIRGDRYSPLAEITTENVGRLSEKWSVRLGGAININQTTPLVIDGVMYLHSGATVHALNAATGQSLWTRQVEPGFPGSRVRGPAYGGGRLYGFGDAVVYAVDARAGQVVESFGRNGQVRIINDALEFKYPGKYKADLDPKSLGYWISATPIYFDNTLYVGIGNSDSLIPGGLLIALDGSTGRIKWVFKTIPQGPEDEGWEIAKDTWIGAGRYGGGVWIPPVIDPDLGLIYFNATNPSPNYDGSSRKGINLFTNAIIALNLATGKLVWHFQTIHHDLWDWDLTTGPLLFDVQSGGTTIKGVGSLSKNCYVYMLNRETGRPINPIVETQVPTTTDVPGDQVWPTQPIPYTGRGVQQTPFCATYPHVADPELAKRVRQQYYPYQVNEFVITAPGNTGGANYGAPSFSPRTGLLYATGKNDAWSIRVKPSGNSLPSETGSRFAAGHQGNIAEPGKTGVTPKATLAAYDPASGERAWYVEIPGSLPQPTASTHGGSLVTAGDVLFQGLTEANADTESAGRFYAFDARTGRQLLRIETKAGVRADPLTYSVNGKQYVAVVATHTIQAFALP